MRGAGKLKLWTGGYINRPGVSPPVFLRVLLFCLLLASTGTMIYGVFSIMGHFGDNYGSVTRPILLALLFFLAPFAIAYTIVVNHPASRALLVVYFIALTIFIGTAYASAATAMQDIWFVVVAVALFGATMWLYVAPRARVYYALIQNKPIPGDLVQEVDKLVAPSNTEKIAVRLWNQLEPLAPFALFVLALFFAYAGFKQMQL
jgi:hypothetical protein